MAAPTPTARGTPGGIKLKNGHSTKVTFASAPTVALWEKAVQPPGIDGGDMVEQTTMHSLVWREMAPRTLKTLTEGKMTCAYDPVCFTTLVAIVNVETVITITFPDASTVAFFGVMTKFEPAENKDGDQPTANVNFVPTNFDFAGHVEAGPAVNSVTGT